MRGRRRTTQDARKRDGTWVEDSRVTLREGGQGSCHIPTHVDETEPERVKGNRSYGRGGKEPVGEGRKVQSRIYSKVVSG